ncbi:cytochrome c oxidase subunit II [Caldalkalibacillus salinus]|uniref:cytochrome c oxidase subunit II n=1 Tax=Caldalkalibacillus salinus TaxID=2803787 RepID=UPI00192273F4|nr:cytochrome c oxidase subunit II [Caldalkalibacillus salinus]
MRKWQIVQRFLPILTVMLLLAGCGAPELSALDPSGVVAEKQLSLIILSLAIMVFVFLVVIVIFTYVLIRYRAKPGQEDEIPEQVEGNHKLEIIWTVIPILLLIVLAIPTVMTTFTLAEEAPEEGDAMRVEVVANQYWWEFRYPDHGIVTAQELHIPTGEKVYVTLDSNDVIHSFWVPAIAGKMDNNPGLTNNFWLQADQAMTYDGRCTELCGPSHALMNFKVVAQEPDEFESWVESMQNFEDVAEEEVESEAVALGREVYATNCISCHAIDSTQEGGIGPNLAGFGDREFFAGLFMKPSDDPESANEELKSWIREPYKYKPDNNMPEFPESQISDEELDALVEYLHSLTLE